MSKKGGSKKVSVVKVNQYRKYALFINPIVLIILVVCFFLRAPLEVIIPLGIVGYGIWLGFVIKANMEDRKLHRKR